MVVVDTKPTFLIPTGFQKRRLIALVGAAGLLYLIFTSWVSAPAGCDWAVNDKSPDCRQASRSALTQMGVDIFDLGAKRVDYEVCRFRRFGTGWGAHDLCDRPPAEFEKCIFYSFGIDNDYSFDTALDEQWNCTGILLDPTVNHPASPGPRLNFLKFGATLLNDGDLGGAGTSLRGTKANDWLLTSIPNLKKFLKHDHVNILKVDCEGCEYSIARDVSNEDPDFFSSVDQLAIEVHVSKNWIQTSEHVHYLGLLYHMLYSNNLRLMNAKIGQCRRSDEDKGCPEEFAELGYLCERGRMCQNLLFARV
ncbi:Methyltransferase-like protein 24 [Rhizophlyctis rosea]|nr:Methyltransferase-like protein 24 [Rhizophlyctis rosea]